MPEMTPVANQIIPPDPQKGLGMMSSILGVQQQRQALQTGQYTQATAQAESQQAQQKNAELQAVGNLTKQAYSSGRYKAADGSFDNNKFANDVAQVAPTYGQAIANESTIRAGELYKNQQTLFNLDQSHRKMIGDALGAMAADPSMDHAKFIDNVEGLRAQFKDSPEVSRMLTSMSTAMPNSSGPELQKALGQASAMATGGSQITQGTNAAGQNQNINPYTGERSMPRMGPGATNPTSPQVAGASSRQVGTAGSDIDRSNEVANLQQQSSAAIPLTQRIDQLSHEINSGNLAKKISETGNWLGFSSINEARSQLNKDLGQVKGLAVSKAGSDSRAATILEGYPTDTTPEGTVHAAMDYIRGTARQNLARGKLLSQYQKSDPEGLRGFQAADNIVSGQSNPLMHEYQSIKTPQEQAEFYKRNFSSRAEASAFRDQVEALKRHSPNVLGQ